MKTVPNEKKKKQIFEQSRNWAFTDFKLLDLKRIYNENKYVIRAIGWGVEICPTTKKKHLQGHIQFINKKRRGGVKKILESKCIHVEACRGTIEHNTTYCSKDGKYQLLGIFISQGHRTDWEDIFKMIEEGATEDDLRIQYYTLWTRYNRAMVRHIQAVQKRNSKKFRKVEVELICGPTGTGKTSKAVEENPDAFKITGAELKWWDGYEMEKTLIIDEYSNDIGITRLLNYLDGFQTRLDVKGSFAYANWTKVIITTNLHPYEIHQNAKPEHLKALNRRLTTITDLYSTEDVPRRAKVILGLSSDGPKRKFFAPPFPLTKGVRTREEGKKNIN